MRKSRNYNLIFGSAITAFMMCVVITGIFWTPYDPNALDASARFLAPSAGHLLGTDNFGRDIFSRVVTGASQTMIIAAVTVAIGAFTGILIGGFTGYFGGVIDEALMRFGDIITAFPSILLALVLISIMGSGKYNIIVALSILFIPSFARVARAEYARRRGYDYVQSARIMGASPLRIMFVHILPNTMPVMLRSIAIGFNNAVLAEASMSYLGIGVQPPDASLGRMLSESQSFMFSAPWYTISAGVAIVLLILGFGLISEGIGGRNGVRY